MDYVDSARENNRTTSSIVLRTGYVSTRTGTPKADDAVDRPGEHPRGDSLPDDARAIERGAGERLCYRPLAHAPPSDSLSWAIVRLNLRRYG